MNADDPFTWWEDKQVAVVVRGDVVRGWVLKCRHFLDPTDERAAGQTAVVLLISDPAVAASYPDIVFYDVLEDGEHGRPLNVRGLWREDDAADVHPPRRARVPHLRNAKDTRLPKQGTRD